MPPVSDEAAPPAPPSPAPSPLWTRPGASPPPLGAMRELAIATIFLTRIPIRFRGVPPTDALVRSVWAFPLVGLLVGLLSAAAYALARLLQLDAPIAALLAVAASVIATGALHEDGLGDVADGFGGGARTDDKLAIMKDSRLGTYGLLAIGIVFGLRVMCLADVGRPGLALCALVAAHMLGRAVVPAVMRLLWPARPTGLAASAGRPSQGRVAAAALIGLAGAIVCAAGLSGRLGLPLATVILVLPPVLAACGVAWLARRQIGGYTGDVLGAVEQGGEAATLLAAAILAPYGVT